MPTPEQVLRALELLTGLPDIGGGGEVMRPPARDLEASGDLMKHQGPPPLACIRPVLVQRAVCPKSCSCRRPPPRCDRCGHAVEDRGDPHLIGEPL